MDFENKNVLIIGAARSGISSAEYLAKKGANVILNDIKVYNALIKEGYGIEKLENTANIKMILGRQPEDEEVKLCSLVILSPGVPPDIKPCLVAQQNNIEVMSEVEFANTEFNGNIIAITGTNGKTTTTYLTGAILKNAGFDADVCGNIGFPFIDFAQRSTKATYAVLEISSFQLSMHKSLKPKIAVITNITPDHLDRHKTMDNYIEAKANIFKLMDNEDTLILNYDDKIVKDLAKRAKCKVKYFSLSEETADIYLKDGYIISKEMGKIIHKSEMRLIGDHNMANAMCAILAGLECNLTIEQILPTLKSFQPVEHRVEFVREVNGVKYINDSKGTNPDASITAINAMEQPIVLIMGGYDKHNDFTQIMRLIKQKVKRIIVFGATKETIIDTAQKEGYTNYTQANTFKEAMDLARESADTGECVLLSPACASWDMFDNFEQRGEIFKDYVNSL